jgi:hypothetical protein
MISDKEIADNLIATFRREMDRHSTMGAIVLALANNSAGVRARFFSAIKKKKNGRPKRVFQDADILEDVESMRKSMEAEPTENSMKRISDRKVVIELLSGKSSRLLIYGRSENSIFDPKSPEGIREINRVIAACERAKKAKTAK